MKNSYILRKECQVLKILMNSYGYDENHIRDIIKQFGSQLRESISLGYSVEAISNNIQSQWAEKETDK